MLDQYRSIIAMQNWHAVIQRWNLSETILDQICVKTAIHH